MKSNEAKFTIHVDQTELSEAIAKFKAEWVLLNTSRPAIVQAAWFARPMLRRRWLTTRKGYVPVLMVLDETGRWKAIR